MEKKWIIHSLDDLEICAAQLAIQLKKKITPHSATTVTLTGDLGSGKTTLTQMVGRNLDITEPICSPTFVITKYYDLVNQPWQRFIHIDAYRLDGEPAGPLGFNELFSNPANLVVIEWPQYIQSHISHSHTHITISIKKNDTRIVTIQDLNVR